MNGSRGPATLFVTAWLALLAAAPCTAQHCPARATLYDVGTGSMWEDLAVQGDLLYVAGGTEGLELWDVSDPAHPVRTARWLPWTWSRTTFFERVDVDERGVVFLRNGRDLSVIATRPDAEPVRIASLQGTYGFLADVAPS